MTYINDEITSDSGQMPLIGQHLNTTLNIPARDNTLPNPVYTYSSDVTWETTYDVIIDTPSNCSNDSMEYTVEYHVTNNVRNVPLGVLLSTFACLTVLGNILVILAVVRERYLRCNTNYFVVSLAIADLIIGAVVMPFAISLEVTHQHWFFGADWCDVWHSFDVLASTASILNLSVIALDRYWAITNPMKYPVRMTHSRIFVLIALVWILSSAISFPAIIWWRSVSNKHPPPHSCTFTEDSVYLVLSSIISFYVPVIVILYAYYRIYRAASEQIRSIKTGSKVMSKRGHKGQPMTLRIHRGGALKRIAHEAVHYARSNRNDSESESLQDLPSRSRTARGSNSSNDGASPSKLVSRKWQKFAISRKLSKIAKEQKAAKTLGIVMGVFCICWVPFFVTNVIYGICHTDCVKKADILFPVFTWLGYINSSMNPIIYACSMRDFRRAFYKILCCCFPAHKLKYMRGRSSYAHDVTTTTSSSPTIANRHLHHVNIQLLSGSQQLNGFKANGHHPGTTDLYDTISMIDS